VASPLSTGCAAAASAEQIAPAANETSQFVTRVNELRASKGLGPVAIDSNLTSVANDWAVHMAQGDAIAHRSNLAAGITINWQLLGENVGLAPTVNQAMDAFIASPTHYKNLVNPKFNYIGVGTVSTPDGLYTAHEFAQVNGAPATAPAPAPAPAAAAPKAPAAPTTTSTPPVVEPPAAVPAVTSTTEAPASTDASVSDFEGSPISSNTNNDKEEHKQAETGC
jgi:hypothetical protein